MSAASDKPNHLTLVPTSPTAADAGTIIGPLPVEVPEGECLVRFSHYDTVFVFQPKLVLTFGVVDPETYAGTELPRWYNVRAISEHRRRSGHFEVGARSLLVADHIRLFGPLTRSSLSLDNWRSVDFLAHVETVEQPSTGIRSSVIRKLERPG